MLDLPSAVPGSPPRPILPSLLGLWLLVTPVLAGCGDDTSPVDGGRPDASDARDAEPAGDAASVDAASPADGATPPAIPEALCPSGTLADGTPCPALAFPTAMGFGRFAEGGRGGVVLHVSHLGDDGEGSLRWALEHEGPRIVVFDVGGTITLESAIVIEEPRLTVAGQTAPGDGVLIRGGALLVQASDVVIRHLRVRPGDGAGETDAISIYGRNDPDHRLRDIILDHVSVSWGTDGLIDLWGRQSDGGDITVQRSILAETLYESVHPEVTHSRAMLVGAGIERVSVLENLFAHNNRRHPHFSSGASDVDVVNNVIYDWGQIGIHFASGDDGTFSGIQVLANYFREGEGGSPDPLYRDWHFAVTPDSTVYLADNVVDGLAGLLPATEASDCYGDPGCADAYRGADCTGFCLADSPLRDVEGVAPMSASDAWASVPMEAGATAPGRDAVDARILDQLMDRRGELVNCVAADGSDRCMAHGGGWPTIDGGEAAADADRDGIPDEWETRHELAADTADGDRHDLSPIYTNVEVYLNELAGDYVLP
jgi:hypothetical protein